MIEALPMDTTLLVSSSSRVSSQVRTYGPQPITGYGIGAQITATVRFDDQCENGYNTFSITADVRTPSSYDSEACGCLHNEVAKAFPELEPFLKWHMCSTDGPLHYIENTMYWLGRRGYSRWDNERAGRTSGPSDPPIFKHAKKTAIWPDMPESFIVTETSISNTGVQKALTDRLPALLVEFRRAIEALGMSW